MAFRRPHSTNPGPKPFSVPNISIAGEPTINFDFAGSACAAELGGAKLAGVACSDDDAQIVITDVEGELLAKLTIHKREHRTLTENVMDIGSALLWSHWRWLQAKVK